MIARQLAAAGLVALVVYLAGGLFVSGYSGEAYDSLAAHVDRLEQNVVDLRDRRDRLVAQAETLRRSPDAVALEARRLGYYRPGEVVVRIEGVELPSTAQSPGVVVRNPPSAPDLRAFLRAASALAFVVTLIVQLLAPSAGTAAPVGGYEIRRASR